MKNRIKKSIVFFSAFIGLSITAHAQVGIGNATPHPGSILDLSNSSNKALRLPVSNTEPSLITSFDTLGMLFTYKDNLYLKTSTGIKVFSPWKWDGDSTHAISSPLGANVGIGIQPLPAVPINLNVGNASGEVTELSTNAAIVIGSPTSNHLLLDNDEIMAKSNPTTATVLKMQEENGTVQIRAVASATTSTVLSAYGNIDAAAQGKILQNGFDLVPPGTVVMWYGAVNGSGYPLMGATANTNWHICDGTVGTPDLRERFIVGAGGDNPSVSGSGYAGYPGNSAGGENFHVLTTGEMPAHVHSASCSTDGSHTHTYNDHTVTREDVNGSNFNNQGISGIPDDQRTTDASGDHSHTITINSTGGGGAHENRPPFFALIYIMKL